MSDSQLLPHVLKAYVEAAEPISNEQLYQRVAASAQIPLALFEETEPVGRSQAPVNLLKRKLRWHQQSLRAAKVLTRIDGERGVWGLATPAAEGLNQIDESTAVLGFSTHLGLAIIGSCKHFFSDWREPISLILTSPPYPIAQPRAYGNPSQAEYVDWICEVLEPVIKLMADGASLALNVSNDIFVPGTPARSTYLERLVIALEDRFGLSLVDRLVWKNPQKPPGPIAWASKRRVQLNAGYEPVIVMTNNPLKLQSNNQRVLMPHTPQHLKLMARGGEQRTADNSDGAYRIRPGSYGRQTAGRIPRNVLEFPHISAQDRAYRAECQRRGIRPHGATMSYGLTRFLVEFLSERGQPVADPMGGSLKTALACEELGRRWVTTEKMVEYVQGASYSFENAPGFYRPPVWAGRA